MAVLIEPHPVHADPAPTGPLLRGLTRARGGTFSPTVHVIHFADGATAHTDLIRLNPNIDAYSIDFAGLSPRQLCHYREVPADLAPGLGSLDTRAAVAAVLACGYPHRTTGELTDDLRAAGYPLGHGSISEHEAIAATQAAIWHVTNDLELDTRSLEEPVHAVTRIGEHPAVRTIAVEPDGLAWHVPLPAGETVYLELTLAGDPQVQAFSFAVGSRSGRHSTRIHLEASVDATVWSPVSNSAVELGGRRPGWRRVRRQLGAAATVSSAGPSGHRGHRHYRLAARGPEHRDGVLDVHQVRLEVAGGARHRNSERVVALYQLLVQAAWSERMWRPSPHIGYVFPSRTPSEGLSLDLTRRVRQVRIRPLIGARTPHGPGVFTPLVAAAAAGGSIIVPARSARLELVG